MNIKYYHNGEEERLQEAIVEMRKGLNLAHAVLLEKSFEGCIRQKEKFI